jgi:hypothetical protein
MPPIYEWFLLVPILNKSIVTLAPKCLEYSPLLVLLKELYSTKCRSSVVLGRIDLCILHCTFSPLLCLVLADFGEKAFILS